MQRHVVSNQWFGSGRARNWNARDYELLICCAFTSDLLCCIFVKLSYLWSFIFVAVALCQNWEVDVSFTSVGDHGACQLAQVRLNEVVRHDPSETVGFGGQIWDPVSLVLALTQPQQCPTFVSAKWRHVFKFQQPKHQYQIENTADDSQETRICVCFRIGSIFSLICRPVVGHWHIAALAESWTAASRLVSVHSASRNLSRFQEQLSSLYI